MYSLTDDPHKIQRNPDDRFEEVLGLRGLSYLLV